MRFVTTVLVSLITFVQCQAIAAPRLERFVVEPPTQVVRLKAFLKRFTLCEGATTDTVPADVCRIDVNVSVKNGKCDVSVEGEVHTKRQHKTIEWVVKNKGGADNIRFADFTNFSSILPRDAKAFGPLVRASGGESVTTYQKAKGGSYYYIFLQWSSGTGAVTYCEVVDPIINNDDGP